MQSMFEFDTVQNYQDACQQFAADMVGFAANPKTLTIMVFEPVPGPTYEWLKRILAC